MPWILQSWNPCRRSVWTYVNHSFWKHCIGIKACWPTPTPAKQCMPMRTDADPCSEYTCLFDTIWYVSAAQYYRISELLQEEQRRYGLMPGKLSEVTQKLSAAAEEYNRIDQEHQAQASVSILWLLLGCIAPHSACLPSPHAHTSGRNVPDSGSAAIIIFRQSSTSQLQPS